MQVNGNLSVLGYLRNVKIEQLSSDPASPVIGRFWFNTNENSLKYYDGSSIQTIAQGGNLGNYLELDGTTAMTGALQLASSDQTGEVDSVAAAKGYVDTGLGTKEDTITGAATTVTGSDLAVSQAMVTDANGKVAAATNATAAEVEYLSGVTSAIQTQLDNKEGSLGYTPVDVAGDTMSGDIAMNGNAIKGVAAPINPNDAARQADIDAAIAGLDFQADVLARQTDTTTDPSTTPNTGDRYIIGDTTALNTNFGTISGVANGDIVEYDGSGFVVEYDVSAQGEGALVWNRGTSTFQFFNGTVWSEFGGLAGVIAGNGLAKIGNTLDVNMGAGVVQLPSDEVGLDLYANGGLMMTEDGTTDSTATGAQVAVRADGTTIERASGGIRVKAAGVDESHLAASVTGNGLNGGAGTAFSVATQASSGITVDTNGVSVDDTEMRTRALYRDGAEAMTGVLTLSSADQTGEANTAAAAKGYVDGEVSTLNTSVSDLETRVTNGYFVYDGTGSSAVSHTVTHNMGNKYVGVQVVDSSDEVIIPDSITYTDNNSLTVTFTQAIGCRVIVTGLKAAA